MSDRAKLYVSLAFFARETARRYRRLKRKYPEPEHADHLEREARASYRYARQWVDRARVARCETRARCRASRDSHGYSGSAADTVMPSKVEGRN